MQSELLSSFASLFAGRLDAYGTDDGGCVRERPDYEKHLNGERPCGIYPLTGDGMCRFGVVDLDIKTDKKPSGDYANEEDVHCAAVNLQKTLKHLSVQSWIERTRSFGRHIWIFSDVWLPAGTMRRALLVASQVAGTSTREINPKQETLSEGQLGNYVRLPYPGGEAFTKRAIFIGVPPWEDSVFEHVEDWVPLALEYRTPIAMLEHIASLYKAPERVQIDTIVRPEHVYGLYSSMNALAKHLHDKPVDQINDRSHHIEAFVRASKDSGLSASETLTLADELAARTGKFDGRTDRERQLRIIVERAWT